MVSGAKRLYMLITILIVIRVTACRVLGKAWLDLGYRLCVAGWGSVSYGVVLIVAVWLGIQINSPDQMLLFCVLFLDNTLYILLY